MKQKKGRDYEVIRKWQDTDRIAKKRLLTSVKAGIAKGDFDDEKLTQPNADKGEGK